jgi:hypothetical protein
MMLWLVLLFSLPPRPVWLPDTAIYVSPIDPSLYISSTFGETRAAHFHAALDFGTQGKTGYPIYAARSGLLHRVLISPLGYGFALYLKHDDGSFTQYAHLRNFSPRIAQRIDSIRIAESMYIFDRVVESLGIRFSAGEVIAWSGDTGAGPPHLHFEVRSPSNSPVNPFLVGYTMPDKIAPRFHGVAVEPLHESTLIQGRRAIHSATVTSDGNSYRFAPLTVTGPFSLAAEVSDRSDHMRNVFAVYKLELRVNHQLVFVSKADSFPIQHQLMMQLDRIYPLLKVNRKAYQRLHRHDGNVIPFYQEFGNKGKLDLPIGTHQIRITASDFAGNTADLSGTIIRIAPDTADALPVPITPTVGRPTYHPTGASVRGLDDVFTPFHNWFVLKQTRDSVWISETLQYPLLRRGTAIPVRRDGLFNDQPIYRLFPEISRSFTTPDGRMSVDVPESAVYDTLSVSFGYWMEGDQLRMQIWQPLEPFRRAYKIGFRQGSTVPGSGLYQLIGSGANVRYSFIGSIPRGDWIYGTTMSDGLFTIRVDTTGPMVTNPRFVRRGTDSVIHVTIQDVGSGIHWPSASISVNGIKGMPETDLKNRLTFHLPGWQSAPINDVVVTVSDRQGNTTEARFRVAQR